MSDDYLWSRSGTPDPEVARLEELLRRYRHVARPWSAGGGTGPPPRTRVLRAAAIAAVLLFAAVLAGAWWLRRSPAGWEVVALAGTPAIAGAGVHDSALLPIGERLTTDASSRASLRIGGIGEATIGP